MGPIEKEIRAVTSKGTMFLLSREAMHVWLGAVSSLYQIRPPKPGVIRRPLDSIQQNQYDLATRDDIASEAIEAAAALKL